MIVIECEGCPILSTCQKKFDQPGCLNRPVLFPLDQEYIKSVRAKQQEGMN